MLNDPFSQTRPNAADFSCNGRYYVKFTYRFSSYLLHPYESKTSESGEKRKTILKLCLSLLFQEIMIWWLMIDWNLLQMRGLLIPLLFFVILILAVVIGASSSSDPDPGPGNSPLSLTTWVLWIPLLFMCFCCWIWEVFRRFGMNDFVQNWLSCQISLWFVYYEWEIGEAAFFLLLLAFGFAVCA